MTSHTGDLDELLSLLSDNDGLHKSIIGNKERYSIGQLEKLGNQEYSVPFYDKVTGKTGIIPVPFTYLGSSYVNLVLDANNYYDHQKTLKRRKRLRRSALVSLVLAGALTAGYIKERWEAYTQTPEYQRIKELDAKAKSLLSFGDQLYVLDGHNVKVQTNFYEGASRCLQITLDDRIHFYSESWSDFSEGDARNLQMMIIKSGTKLQSFRGDHFPDYAQWQAVYEKLINDLADNPHHKVFPEANPRDLLQELSTR